MPAIPHRICDLKSCIFYVSPFLLLPLNLISLDFKFRLYSGLHTDRSPSDRCSLSFLPHYSRLPLRPVLTDTTSKFSHKLSSISANRRHEHTQTHTHTNTTTSFKSPRQRKNKSKFMTAPAVAAYSFPTASKQTNKQTFLSTPKILSRKKTHKHLSRFLKSWQASFLTTRVPIPTKLTLNYKPRICAATT